MARRFQLSARTAWAATAAAASLLALLAGAVDQARIDWQPGRAGAEPWRALSAAFVHYSSLHLLANLTGAVMVGALGHVAGVPARSLIAWLAAWPLTQAGLLLQPSLLHYGGLSGVLHAGVAVVAVHLLMRGDRTQRGIAAALLVGLLVKVGAERPWDGPLRIAEGWDIAVAPLAHATGTAAGIACSAVAELLHRAGYGPGSRQPRMRPTSADVE